ncbi:MAG: NRDE family protein [Planctomycetes bacterium]|nr:NRDE family protein [Planctomycetota bacterium]
MCILIVLRDLHREHPLVVGGNRDERTDRPSSPPGLWVGERNRVLSPRDRLAGGTWLAVDPHGRVAGITNLASVPPVPEAPSRGHLPHLALDQPSLDAAIAAVRARVGAEPHSGFQLVLADAARTVVLRNTEAGLAVLEWTAPVLVLTNEHAPGELSPRGLPPALQPGLDLSRRLELLAKVLQDRGAAGHHAICKRGDGYGTVSSSLLAVPAGDPRTLIWRYAAGPPDATAYRDYGNLGRRLLPEP